MAKDPAFLFYPNDWMGGTMGLTRHQKGCYIDLLVFQFNRGPFSLETIKTVLGQDQAVWTVLSTKFKQDSEGNFFNERLATEIKKRKEYSESRRKNKMAKKEKETHDDTYDSTHDQHMMHHMENRNRNTSSFSNTDVIYNAEEEILKCRKEFEAACMSAGKSEQQGKVSLKKFHLWYVRENKYPVTRKQAIAGFSLWLMNSFSKNEEIKVVKTPTHSKEDNQW